MDSACILACDIEKACSQYDENLFADNDVFSSPCSRLSLDIGLGFDLRLG